MEPMITDGDTPRTRKSDPVNSHHAADRSQVALKPTKQAVLDLVGAFGALTGADINSFYARYQSGYSFPIAKYDTPRKRAGELAADGFLIDTGNNPTEAEWVLTIKGLEAIA